MKLRRAGIITRIVILALVLYAGVTLFSVKRQIEEAQAKHDELQQQVDDIQQGNSELQYDIDHSTDPDVIEGVARNEIGLVRPNEKIFYDVGD